ncbi:YjhT family mutarotase [Vibrio sp.]|uniref:YjhT family mutarotase n=1 Tax=Vibrio sp. TaxID=678 RepID=UPI003D118314
MSLVIDSIPDLPIGIKHGVGGVLGGKIYAGLGSAGKQLFFFDLEQPQLGWQSAADFPGCARDDAAFAVSGHKLYVFSGAGVEPGNSHPTVLLDGYQFDSLENRWTQLEGGLPIGLLGASCCCLTSGELVFFGGYRKETFDDFVAELSAIDAQSEPEKHQQLLTHFMSQQVDAYGWNQDFWTFTPADNRWSIVGRNAFPANCGAGVAQDGDRITLIEGEIKPGLRSLQTKQFELAGSVVTKGVLCPSIVDVDSEHEGLAGHFVATFQNQVYVVGGAYFIGSQKNFRNGRLYSHQGLTKHYSNKVWKYDGSGWTFAGVFGEALAYGLSVSLEQRMYIIGGENCSGEAQTRCFSLY